MLSKTYVIGDLHGGLKALIQLLDRAEVSPQDRLIFLGDYVDGWSDTVALIDFLLELQRTHSCVFIRGNHEEMVLKWLKKEEDNALWRFHGGQATVEAYADVNETKKAKHIAFLEALLPYYIDFDNRLFVHAGFTHIKGVTHEYFKPLFWWDRTLWELAQAVDPTLLPTDLRYPKRLTHYHEIFIGHTPTLHSGSTIPMQAANVWNVDTGAAFTGKASIMNVATKAFWQSDALPNLYPDERGRNPS